MPFKHPIARVELEIDLDWVREQPLLSARMIFKFAAEHSGKYDTIGEVTAARDGFVLFVAEKIIAD